MTQHGGREIFAMDGEDVLIERLFYNLIQHDQSYREFYVDIGAADPIAGSNTCLLYRRGWRGINIDANQAQVALLQQSRPGDINLNLVIGERSGHAGDRLIRGSRWNPEPCCKSE
jgi:hypothetical protein